MHYFETFFFFFFKQKTAYEIASCLVGSGYPKMAPEKIQQALRDIREYVDSFDYPRLQALVSSPDEIKNLYRRCRNGYEKLQVFRLLELDQDHPVIRKFVNETYHIENEFICQLDPSRFDLIPEYVIMECDKLIALPPAANQSSVARIAWATVFAAGR